MSAAIDSMEPQVRPELRPTLATGSFDPTAVNTSATVDDGGDGWFGPARSRIVPLVSTAPGTISAIAASTLFGAPCSGAACETCATVAMFCIWQFASHNPGCTMGSPALPWSDLS